MYRKINIKSFNFSLVVNAFLDFVVITVSEKVERLSFNRLNVWKLYCLRA